MQNGLKIISSRAPSTIVTNITFIVINGCSPPVHLAAHYVAGAVAITAMVVSPSPLTIGMVVLFVSEIYEYCQYKFLLQNEIFLFLS